MKKFIYFILIVAIVTFGFLVWKNYKPISNTPITNTPVVSNQTASNTDTTVATSTPFVESAYLSKSASSTLGRDYITDNKKMALYIFTKDTPGVSVCTGECLLKWPIYGPGISIKELAKLPPPPADLSAIERTDGVVQFTWKNMPLYYFASDKVAGDTKGHDFGGVWYLIEAK